MVKTFYFHILMESKQCFEMDASILMRENWSICGQVVPVETCLVFEDNANHSNLEQII